MFLFTQIRRGILLEHLQSPFECAPESTGHFYEHQPPDTIHSVNNVGLDH